jgi:hypothetical protein
LGERTVRNVMREWSFSASAEWVVGLLLVVTIIAAALV